MYIEAIFLASVIPPVQNGGELELKIWSTHSVQTFNSELKRFASSPFDLQYKDRMLEPHNNLQRWVLSSITDMGSESEKDLLFGSLWTMGMNSSNKNLFQCPYAADCYLKPGETVHLTLNL